MAGAKYKGRVISLVTLVLLVFTAIGARLSVLHLHPPEWVLEPIEDGYMFEWNPMGSRGRIVDRNGQILAMDRPSYHLYVDPKYIAGLGNADDVCKYLSMEFDLSESEIRAELANTNSQYRVLKKYLSDKRIERFERKGLGVVYSLPEPLESGTERVYLRGVKFAEVPVRSYPKGPLMAHVVGFANREGSGAAGIELRYNEVLEGKAGKLVSEFDGSGKEIYRKRQVDIPAQDGATVTLTLDQQLQYVVEKTIEKTCHEFSAKAVWAIVQDVRTGEILAMASYPTYDLNSYGDPRTPPEWRRNRAISFNYEPGSTMKAGVIAAALDNHIVKEDDIFDCENGYWVYGGKALRDSHGEGEISVAEIIKVSSNIGTAKIALQMGNDLVYDSLRKFHFGSRLGVGIPGEEGGIFYPPDKWSKISITRIGMGHEIGVTAMQVLSMMSAIAFNGYQMKPYLVKAVTAPDGTVIEENRPQVIGRPISPETSRRMRTLLAAVTEEGGTGTKAQVEGYSVGGKTGTAQKIRPASEGGGYYSKNFTSSFVGFLPVDDPAISIIVVADDPGEWDENGRKIKYYGGTVCGPAFKEIAEFAVRYLRIAPDGNKVYVTRPEE